MTAPSPVARLASWRRWLRARPLGKRATPQPPDPLRSIGQSLREAREAKGLRMRDLAQRTRISIAVLEALEKGWKERLPQATYLRTMLLLLEQELELPPHSLEAVLPHVGQGTRGKTHGPGQGVVVLPPFVSPFLTRWQGALAYSLLTLGLLYGLNLQQQRLARQGLLAVRPIPLAPMPAAPPPGASRRGQAAAAPGASSLGTFPDLAPLSGAASGQAMNLLIRESRLAATDLSLGLLSLRLKQPTRLELRSPRGGDTLLETAQGAITLPVLPPFQLRLTPAPGPGAVRWRDKALADSPPQPPSGGPASKETTAVYTVPAARAASPAPAAAAPKSR